MLDLAVTCDVWNKCTLLSGSFLGVLNAGFKMETLQLLIKFYSPKQALGLKVMGMDQLAMRPFRTTRSPDGGVCKWPLLSSGWDDATQGGADAQAWVGLPQGLSWKKVQKLGLCVCV